MLTKQMVKEVLEEVFGFAVIDEDAQKVFDNLIALSNMKAAEKSAQRVGLCPECGSEILPTNYCMMGHWCGETPRQ